MGRTTRGRATGLWVRLYSPRVVTGRTALRVLVSALRVELLVVGSERELRATLNTRKGTVFVGQLDDRLLGSRVRSGHRAERLRGEPTRRTLTSSTTQTTPKLRGLRRRSR